MGDVQAEASDLRGQDKCQGMHLGTTNTLKGTEDKDFLMRKREPAYE